MTISEAQSRWGVSDKIMLDYLNNGLIPNVSIVNNNISIPEINKPFRMPSNVKRTAENIYLYIIKACNEGYYINSGIIGLNISESVFSACISELLDKDILKKTSDYIDDTSNIGLTLSLNGCEYFKQCQSKSSYEKVLKLLNLGLTIIPQIVNLAATVGGK